MTLDNALFGKVTQVGIVVRDAHKTVREYADRLGIGPWWVRDTKPPVLTNTRLRGKRVDFTYVVALAYTGNMQLELLSPLEGPTVYDEFLAAHGEGIHHLSVEVRDGLSPEAVIEQMATRGFPPVMQGNFAGIEFTYFDVQDSVKMLLEITKRPSGYVRPEPDYWYPFKPDRFGPTG